MKILNTLLWFAYFIGIILMIIPIGEILCKSKLGAVVFSTFYILCILEPLADILFKEILKLKETK